MNQTQKHGLQIYEQELSPEERQLLQVCALFQEPISKTNLLKILRKINPVRSAFPLCLASYAQFC